MSTKTGGSGEMKSMGMSGRNSVSTSQSFTDSILQKQQEDKDQIKEANSDEEDESSSKSSSSK